MGYTIIEHGNTYDEKVFLCRSCRCRFKATKEVYFNTTESIRKFQAFCPECGNIADQESAFDEVPMKESAVEFFETIRYNAFAETGADDTSVILRVDLKRDSAEIQAIHALYYRYLADSKMKLKLLTLPLDKQLRITADKAYTFISDDECAVVNPLVDETTGRPYVDPYPLP